MKSLLIRMAGFGAFTAVVWGLLFLACFNSPTLEYHLIAQEKNAGHVNLRSLEWSSTELHETEILFFGSSTCYSGIDPRALDKYGIAGFNFCSSSQNIGNSNQLVKAALAEANPKALVLDIYPRAWTSPTASFESTKDWIVNSNLWGTNWKTSYRSLVLESADPFTFAQLLYFSMIRNFRPAGSNPELKKDRFGEYRGLGWVERTYPAIESIECDPVFVDMSPYLSNAIFDIRTLCEARGIQLILLNPPQLCEEDFDQPRCFEGLTYIEGNRWPGAKTPTNYYDDHHLVGAGARDYSAWLAREIAALHHALP